MRPLYDLASVFADQIRLAESESALMLEPVVALVTDNKDPQKLGRIKVKFPTLSSTDMTEWIPIIMAGAGKNRGWFFIPEIDDEVLVMFEYGDINKPLMVGALWNGKDKPPEKNPGGNHRRVIKSRAGSKITFDDEGGKEKVVIEDGKGVAKITIDSVANKITIEAMQGDVCFQSPAGNMQVVAQSCEMNASQNVEIHSGAPMQWGADTSAAIKGSSTAISGAMVNMNCGAAQMPQAPTANVEDIADKYGS